VKGVDSDTVLYEVDDDGVLLLTLNRPDRNNSWTRELEMALHDLLEQAAEADDVRAIVITGAGKAFCPGLDMEELERVSRPGEGIDNTGRRAVQLPAFVPKPVIAAINGACAGLGFITALSSDIRIAALDAKLTTSFARRGLPAEEASAWFLPRIVGHAVALDLLLSARVVTGEEAAAIGLVHRAVPRDEVVPVALAYARDLARNCSPLSMALAKRQVYADWERSMRESRQDAMRLVAEHKPHPDRSEGVRSFVERRPPAFLPFTEPFESEPR